MEDTMGKRRRQFTAEFKREALELLRQSPEGITAVAQQLGISASTLGMWASKVRRGLAPSADPREPQQAETIDEEVRRLRKENQQLKLERDFLKKATAFFAKESK
jgi:transposase